jgi:hypothetical protein
LRLFLLQRLPLLPLLLLLLLLRPYSCHSGCCRFILIITTAAAKTTTTVAAPSPLFVAFALPGSVVTRLHSAPVPVGASSTSSSSSTGGIVMEPVRVVAGGSSSVGDRSRGAGDTTITASKSSSKGAEGRGSLAAPGLKRSDSIQLLSSAVKGIKKGAVPTAIEVGNLSGVYVFESLRQARCRGVFPFKQQE